MSLITCSNISLYYDNTNIIDNLSFCVNEGDYLCIVGENGSGKTTLIKALLSLKGVSSGSIKFGDGLRKNEIGYLPQQTQIQKDFPASVWEIVLSGCLNKRGARPFYSASDKARAQANLERLEIKDLKKASYCELSGGQQQRVLLARALCSTTKLLLLDEPVASLDPVMTQKLYSIIKELNTDGITIVMVSHDIESSIEYSTNILHLKHSSFFFGSTADYLDSDIGKEFIGGEQT